MLPGKKRVANIGKRKAVELSERQVSLTAADADLASTIGQLPSDLQLMVTLLARMFSPVVEGKMMEKRGKDALDQAASIMVAVSYSFSVYFLFLKCCELALYFSLCLM